MVKLPTFVTTKIEKGESNDKSRAPRRDFVTLRG